MTVAFTLCSNNYFAQAHALAKSFLHHNPLCIFYIVLVDKKVKQIVSDQPRLNIVEIHSIETNILELASRYNIIELNTAVKPHVFTYLFETTNAENIFYLDPDIYIFKHFGELEQLFSNYKVLLTPHILSAIPVDNKTPQENDFLNYGIYNLGFIGLRRSGEVNELLMWWKERTYTYGYINLSKGLFVDQLWINFVPLFYKETYIISHPGYNMGPWNLHERFISFTDSTYHVNEDQELFFYHFSTFNPLKELKLHPVFTRYNFCNRTDLSKLYTDYAKELLQLGYPETNTLPCYYTVWRNNHLTEKELINYNQLPLKNKIARKIKNAVPEKVRKSLLAFIEA